MTKELLTIEFRYMDASAGEHDGGYRNKTITIGVFDTINEAIEAGNKAISILSKKFEVRENDKFMLKFLSGTPNKLVSNCCYPTNGIQYFAKIETLKFDDLSETIEETFKAHTRRKQYINDNDLSVKK